MAADNTDLAYEDVQMHTSAMDTIAVPAHSDLLPQWQSDVADRAAAAGLGVEWEWSDEHDDAILRAVTVAGDPRHEPGSRFVRVRIPQEPDFALDTDLVVLPHPADVVELAAATLGIDPAQHVTARNDEPLPALSSPAAQLRSLHAAALESCRASQRILPAGHQGVESYTTLRVHPAVRHSVPGADVRLVAQPDSLARTIVVSAPALSCTTCGSAPVAAAEFAARSCPRCAITVPDVAIAAVHLHSTEPGRLSAPSPEAIAQVASLAVAADAAARLTAGAADAWQLTAQILSQIAASPDTADPGHLLRRWAHDNSRLRSVCTDYGWVGIEGLGDIRPYQPAPIWQPAHEELLIAVAAGERPQVVTRLDTACEQHLFSAIAVAEASAQTLRSQLRPAAETVAAVYDPTDVDRPLRCRITEPDAHRIEGPLRPLPHEPLGRVDGHAGPHWAISQRVASTAGISL